MDSARSASQKIVGLCVAGVFFLLVGIRVALLSMGPLRNLFEEYQDSPTWVYLAYGLPLLLFGVGILGLGLWLLVTARREWQLR